MRKEYKFEYIYFLLTFMLSKQIFNEGFSSNFSRFPFIIWTYLVVMLMMPQGRNRYRKTMMQYTEPCAVNVAVLFAQVTMMTSLSSTICFHIWCALFFVSIFVIFTPW